MRQWHSWGRASAAWAVAVVVLGAPASPAGRSGPEIVSRSSDGVAGNGHCFNGGAVTSDGRFVAFLSLATNLTPGDPSASLQIFLRDRVRGTTERVSENPEGEGADAAAFAPCVSANGRWVLFESDATNLVEGDTGGYRDVYLRDRRTGDLRRVSVAEDGSQAEGHSGTGWGSALSATGRFAVFSSHATNLLPLQGAEPPNVYLADLRTGRLRLVSVRPGGAAAGNSYDPSVSANGRFVAFLSDAGGLVRGISASGTQVYVRDMATGAVRCASLHAGIPGNRQSASPVVSDDGNVVAFTSLAGNLVGGDTNGRYDVFVHDFRSDETRRISVGPNGEERSGDSYSPSISRSGRRVTFVADEPLVPEDTNPSEASDVYAWDSGDRGPRLLTTTRRGRAGNRGSESSATALSPNGRWLAFVSAADNLAPGDENGFQDAFVLALDDR